MGKEHTKNDQLTKIRLLEGCGGKTMTVAAQFGYNHHELENYLGNIGQMEFTRLFGGEISVLLRTEGVLPEKMQPLDLRYEWGDRNGVTIGYPAQIAQVLERFQDVIPSIQTSSEPKLREVFPSSDWTLGVNDRGVRFLAPTVNRSRIVCKSVTEAESLRILLRVYAHFEDTPYRIRLALYGIDLATFDVHQIDSFLFSPVVGAQPDDFELTLWATALYSGEPLRVAPTMNITGARLCAIQE